MATIKELIEKAGQVAVLKAHPVGSYFITEEDRNPAEILGLGGVSTWVKLEGRVLLGANSTYPVGSEGGESNVTLTIENMPRHTHRVYKDDNFSANSNGVTNTTNAWKQALVNASNTTCNIAIEYVGGGQSHNNMPPFRSVFIWRRTA